jgi:hypothetical protein
VLFLQNPYGAAPKKVWVRSLPTFLPTDENFPMHLPELVSNGSRAKSFFGPFLKNKVPMLFNSLSAKSVLAGEKLIATYSISTWE